jgi:hypothetical protein
MINIVCGYIGSGRLEYVLQMKKENDIVLFYDKSNRDKQFNLLKNIYYAYKHINKTIWYIIDYPTDNELCFINIFCRNVSNYIWLNTTIEQSNIFNIK